jgi:tetratricopeptide (TPR) repeat protein
MLNKVSAAITAAAVSGLLAGSVQASELTIDQNSTAATDFQAQQLVIGAYKLMLKSDYASAVPVLQKSLKLDADNAEAHRYLAFSLLHQGQVAQALQESKKVLEMGSDLPHDHFAMGEAQFYDGKPDLALKFYIGALQINPLFVQARLGVIRSLIAMGKVQQARQICMDAAYKSPGWQKKAQFKKLLDEMDTRSQIASQRTFGS